MDEPVEEYGVATATTETAGSKPSRQNMRALSRRLMKMVKRTKTAEKRYEPRSTEGVEFYFDKQWSEADERAVKDRGQHPVVVNRVKPTTKLVHGLMVAQPQDWIAKPVGKNDDALADSATAGLKHVANQNNWRDLRSMAYWWSLVYSFGVVMTGLYVRNKDPRTEAVQIRLIDPREFGWDPMSRENDLSDARYVRWTRKVDLADAQRQYPKHAAHLARLAKSAKDKSGDTDDITEYPGVASLPTPPVSKWDEYSDWNDSDADDKGDYPQVTLHEIWERVPEKASLLDLTDGTTIEFDPADPESAMRLQQPDVLRYYEDDVPRIHYHVTCGPVVLKTGPSPYEHQQLPFAVCWHERDHHGDPVSFVESLKDIQREVNFRRSKAMHVLNNPNLRVSPSVLERMEIDRDGFGELWHAGGGIVVANPGDVEILRENDSISNQFQWMQDSKAEIQSVSGINDDLIGYNSSSKSGVAKQTQMQQGAMMQRPNEANLRLFDKIVGEQVFQLIQQAHTDEWTVRITDESQGERYITLNQQVMDPETGQTRILNDISHARAEIEIDDAAWSPTDRERVSEMFASMASDEPDPLVRQQLRRMAIEAASVPKKAKLLAILDEGIEMMKAQMMPPQPDPAQQEMQARMQQAEIGKVEGDAAKSGAQAQKAAADAMKAEQDAMGQAMLLGQGQPDEIVIG